MLLPSLRSKAKNSTELHEASAGLREAQRGPARPCEAEAPRNSMGLSEAPQ